MIKIKNVLFLLLQAAGVLLYLVLFCIIGDLLAYCVEFLFDLIIEPQEFSLKHDDVVVGSLCFLLLVQFLVYCKVFGRSLLNDKRY